MASFRYHALPGFGEECREKYGFSDACLIGNRLVVTGQTGMDPLTRETSPKIEEQIAQAFKNIDDLIIRTLVKEGHTIKEGDSGWDYVVKLHAFFVGLSGMRAVARENMVHYIKKWCPRHQPLFTMVGIESLPFPEHLVEFEVDVWIP
ncbi:Endoribonuclease L-PSP/chorismate mutase-like protein [Penicillium waksmanii]|uniref:Endoribonuclease L-PSP/chorismate mutase-like protein n=1 Tax=Penicillium waksmanii TaxID=69791 RepID=UPI002549C02A|nr:Endoribonuclease L-PSP/chorismate mutase-like protein [Penicillium waksmanii]KAJ5975076.1 Endoribonuclease L-PSP/chorismate mutase-like protein [Penicillium waksmanii]